MSDDERWVAYLLPEDEDSDQYPGFMKSIGEAVHRAVKEGDRLVRQNDQLVRLVDDENTLTLRIDLSNAAFEDDEVMEVVRILRRLNERIRGNQGLPESDDPWTVLDVNGNTVGSLSRTD